MKQSTKPISRRQINRPAVAALGVITLSTLAIPGCIASGSSYVKAEGRYISNDTVNMITPGETTREWVHAVLGEPSSQSTLSDGTEIWKWSSKRITKSSGSVFLLVHGSNRDVTERTVYVEFEGDLVARAWRD